jgi:phytoene dehydrogenase-like protein
LNFNDVSLTHIYVKKNELNGVDPSGQQLALNVPHSYDPNLHPPIHPTSFQSMQTAKRYQHFDLVQESSSVIKSLITDYEECTYIIKQG